MKRTLLALALLTTACVGRKLPEVQQDLAAAKAEEAAALHETSKANDLAAAADRGVEAENARLSRAHRSLTGLQPEVVRKWGSDVKKLQALKKQHPMPAALLAALDAAQASAKDSTPEKRFEASLVEGKLTEAGALIDSWEAADFSYESPEETDACTPEVPELKCRPNAKIGVLLCEASENTWMIWADHGRLTTRSAPLLGLDVVERPAPGVWVLRKGSDRNLYESQENYPLLRWVADLPAEHAGHKSQLTWKNLDNDPFPEGIFELEGTVRLFDVTSNHDVTALSELDSCRQLTALAALPETAKAGCATKEAAAKAELAAADAGK